VGRQFSRLSDWLAWQETLHPSTIDLGLERLNRTLLQLGWRRPKCPVITVGGTNGKGSCVALLGRLLSEAGYRVGTFTSPHLLEYNERITLAGREVSDASLMAAFERIDAARGADTLTFFEFNTLAALLVFETACLDVIVLEVGLGGRLDAVNVVDADVALVTSIALDHCDWLGPDVASIGREKAGIFRAGRPAVFGAPDMPDSIAEVAQTVGARLLRAGRDFTHTQHGEHWSWQGSGQRWDDLPPPALFGDVQYGNASAVLAVLERLSDRLPVDRTSIVRGLQSVRLAGRFQSFQRGGIEWIVDVAHNPAAARVLAQTLKLKPLPDASARTFAVCGILGDKDIEGVAAELRESFTQWVIVKPASARAIDEAVLADRMRHCGVPVATVAPTVAAGCEAVRAVARPGDRVVAFGSFLTAGPALEWLRIAYTSPPWNVM
jgi:dihydrofolate synthase / folylpolyglutamate synthase